MLNRWKSIFDKKKVCSIYIFMPHIVLTQTSSHTEAKSYKTSCSPDFNDAHKINTCLMWPVNKIPDIADWASPPSCRISQLQQGWRAGLEVAYRDYGYFWESGALLIQGKRPRRTGSDSLNSFNKPWSTAVKRNTRVFLFSLPGDVNNDGADSGGRFGSRPGPCKQDLAGWGGGVGGGHVSLARLLLQGWTYPHTQDLFFLRRLTLKCS